MCFGSCCLPLDGVHDDRNCEWLKRYEKTTACREREREREDRGENEEGKDRERQSRVTKGNGGGKGERATSNMVISSY